MHFDRLDKSYTMVKSNLNFDKVTLTGLTDLCIPVRPVRPVVPILIVNTNYILLNCFLFVEGGMVPASLPQSARERTTSMSSQKGTNLTTDDGCDVS